VRASAFVELKEWTRLAASVEDGAERVRSIHAGSAGNGNRETSE
jgi:hypothetical protein